MKTVLPQQRIILLLLAHLAFSLSGCSWITTEKRIRHMITTDYGPEQNDFQNSMSGLSGIPLTAGNKVTELVNGDQIFGSMLKAIQGAEKSITLEMYIWSSGKIGSQFVEALSEKAQKG